MADSGSQGRSLVDFVRETSSAGRLRVEEDLGSGYVRLMVAEAERRQAAQDIGSSEDIVLELLRNSRDAGASVVFVATAREGARRTVTVVDDGSGIPPGMHARVFEPRVTGKLDTAARDNWGFHGRGMALFSIAEAAEEAFVTDSVPDCGTSVHVEIDTRKVGEKSDQSLMPVFEMGRDGVVNVRGPRNILRTACEFAIDSRKTLAVYVGSPAAIAAAVYRYGCGTLSRFDRMFCRDASQLPIVQRLATAADGGELAELCASISLPLSERTARRILSGDVAPAEPILDCIRIKNPAARRRAGAKDAPPPTRAPYVSLSKTDRDAFAAAVAEAYRPIAESYYLSADVEPRVRFEGDRFVITIPAVPSG